MPKSIESRETIPCLTIDERTDTTGSETTSSLKSVEDYRYLPSYDEMGYYPVEMVCPHCHFEGWTKVEDTYGFRTWVWIIANWFLCICCSFAPCCAKQVSTFQPWVNQCVVQPYMNLAMLRMFLYLFNILISFKKQSFTHS